MLTYEEFETDAGISPSSPEGYYAELAWNAAILTAMGVARSAKSAETEAKNVPVLILDELSQLDTGFRGHTG